MHSKKNKNTVELLGYYGDDETIACSAWTSTSRDLTEDKRARIPALIKRLWLDGHETPFEKGVVHFLVNTDISAHIQIIKHRIAVSVNAESARYKELKEDKYYLPEDWSGIKTSRNINVDTLGYKESAEFISGDWLTLLEDYVKRGNILYHAAVEDLTPILGRKRAKESARFFKTYNSQIQADVMFNMRSFANFQRLRNSEHAQLEIRDIAKAMLDIVSSLDGNPFQYTLEAWREDGTIPNSGEQS